LNNRFLRAAKAAITEGLLENVERGGHEGQYTVLPLTPADRLRGTAYPLIYQFIYWQSLC
jgi:hypothetical protein